MAPTFSAEEFFAVFAAYNTAVWPAQILLYVLAVSVVAFAFRGPRWRHRAVLAVLGIVWIWMGIAYHWVYFSTINPAAGVFGALFVGEGLLLLYLGVSHADVRFAPIRDTRGIFGGVLIAYALLLYPSIGAAAGHAYPAQPTFGVPCPTTIFTIGVLLWAARTVPGYALIVPILWSAVGMTAVAYFGVLEDAMLPVAGLLGAVLIYRRPSAQPSSAHGTPHFSAR